MKIWLRHTKKVGIVLLQKAKELITEKVSLLEL